jgi:hypothetical protein
MGLQSLGSFNFKNFGTPNLGVSRQNDILVQALWLGTKNTIRGKVMAFPKFGSWWVLWVCVCMWFVHAPKVLKLCTNLLFGSCKFVWIIDPLAICPSPHLGATTCLSTPKVLPTKERTPILYPFIVFTFGLIVESIKEFGGVSLTLYWCNAWVHMCSNVLSHCDDRTNVVTTLKPILHSWNFF